MCTINSKELFEYVRTFDIENIPSLESVISKYKWKSITINELFEIIISSDNFLLIDTRSNKEYENTSIPFALNFPVLSTTERHNVGLIYKTYSKKAALKLSMEYADPKLERLKEFLCKNNVENKKIIIHCWRGGGRSSYLAKMICDLGYKPTTLIGGIKSYRNKVNEFFSQQTFPYDLIELSGLTGTGKTELLRMVSENYPVIDLELAARHFSSLFGFVPYEIKDFKPITNQSAFENNILSQIIKNKKYFAGQKTFLIESESKKIGDFLMPKPLYDKLLKAPTIKVISSLDKRLSRIVNDYFGDKSRGISEMEKIFKKSERFFRQQLSNPVYNDLLIKLKAGDVYKFSEIMINKYYDVRYKEKDKAPLAVINSDNIKTAVEELLGLLTN